MAAFDPEGKGDKAQIVNDMVDRAVRSPSPTGRSPRLQAKAGQPVWTYYFSYVPAAEKARKPVRRGAHRRDPLRVRRPRAEFAPEDLPLANAMNAYWAAFVEDGQAGLRRRPGLAEVRPPRTRAYMEFGADGPQAREHFLKARLDWQRSGGEVGRRRNSSSHGSASG